MFLLFLSDFQDPLLRRRQDDQGPRLRQVRVPGHPVAGGPLLAAAAEEDGADIPGSDFFNFLFNGEIHVKDIF